MTIKTNDVRTSNTHGDYTVLEIGTDTMTIQFHNTGAKRVVSKPNVYTNSVKDLYAKYVFGVGYVGEGTHTVTKNKRQTKAYVTWTGMLGRCYNDKRKLPAYEGVTVSDVWHNFQNFAEWFEENYVEGYDLDKDILSGATKVYSPATCAFIPTCLNNLIKVNKKNKYTGVSKSKNKWRAQCKFEDKLVGLGSYNTQEEAYEAYRTFKAKVVHAVAEQWEGRVDQRVTDKLKEWK